MKEFFIQWHITNLCNLRCRHCYNTKFNAEEDLSWNKLKVVCDSVISALNVWRAEGIINITGGEPLIKEELFDVLDYLNNAKEIKELAIITNLTLINESIIARLTRFKKLKAIKFSLEGLNSSSNDAIRGLGSFKKILEALEVVNRNKRFETILMFTLLKQNINQARGLLNFCREFNINGFILERFIPLGQSKNNTQEVIDSNDYKKVVKDLLQVCQLDADIDDLAKFRAFFIKIKNRKPFLFGAPCTIAADGCCIMPNADVLPCRRFGSPIGNILKIPFVEIVGDSSILTDMKYKRRLSGKCRSCLVKDCKGCRALAYSLSGDYLAEDSQCWLKNL